MKPLLLPMICAYNVAPSINNNLFTFLSSTNNPETATTSDMFRFNVDFSALSDFTNNKE